MIATVMFFTEEGMLEGMLMGDVQVAAMCEGAREVFVRARAQLEDVKFVGCERGGSQERAEEAGPFWGVQGGSGEYWRLSWFAFIPERSLCL